MPFLRSTNIHKDRSLPLPPAGPSGRAAGRYCIPSAN